MKYDDFDGGKRGHGRPSKSGGIPSRPARDGGKLRAAVLGPPPSADELRAAFESGYPEIVRFYRAICPGPWEANR